MKNQRNITEIKNFEIENDNYEGEPTNEIEYSKKSQENPMLKNDDFYNTEFNKTPESIESLNKENESITEINVQEYIGKYLSIDLDYIKFNKNIRETYNDKKSKELIESIKQYGQLHPIHIYWEDNFFWIISGFRRYFSILKLGLKKINCIICKKPDTLENIFLQITENIQRESIDEQELAKSLYYLKNGCNKETKEIASKINKSSAFVSQYLKLYKLIEKYGDKFEKAGYKLTVRVANRRFPKNLTEDEELEIVYQLINENNVKKNNEKENKKKRKKKNIEKNNHSDNNIQDKKLKNFIDKITIFHEDYVKLENLNDENQKFLVDFLRKLYLFLNDSNLYDLKKDIEN